MVDQKKQKVHGEAYVKFGKNIAREREKLNMSQADFSSKIGIPQSTYAGYESGTRKVPLSTIIKLSEIFNVSADDLLGSGNSRGSSPKSESASNQSLLSSILSHWDWNFEENEEGGFTIFSREGVIFPIQKAEVDIMVARIGNLVNSQLINQLTDIIRNLEESKKDAEEFPVLAARNDNESPEQLEKMQRDIEYLRELAGVKKKD